MGAAELVDLPYGNFHDDGQPLMHAQKDFRDLLSHMARLGADTASPRTMPGF